MVYVHDYFALEQQQVVHSTKNLHTAFSPLLLMKQGASRQSTNAVE